MSLRNRTMAAVVLGLVLAPGPVGASEPTSELIYAGEGDDLVIRPREDVEVDSLERTSEILAKDLDTGLLTTYQIEYVGPDELSYFAAGGVYPIPALVDTSDTGFPDGYYVEKIEVFASLWDGTRSYDARRIALRYFAVERGVARWLNPSDWEEETVAHEDCGARSGGLTRCRAGGVVLIDTAAPEFLDEAPASTGSAEREPELDGGE